jgi:hypothetical protein
MSKIIEFFDQSNIKTDWKTQYIRYRLGRLKHQYWLWNRKNKDHALIDEYDYKIINNCQQGQTVFFASSGYYLKDIYENIDAIEMHPVVKTFYPDTYICEDRSQLTKVYPHLVDNFAVVNNRGDIWTELENVADHCKQYTQIMRAGCRFFYSFRDTQIVGFNRLTLDIEKYFLDWAKDLERTHDLKLVWYDINFKKKLPDVNGYYDQLENPDTTNGNLKFWFVYKGEAWDIKI